LWVWLTRDLADYKLVHAVDERGELDLKRLKEAAEELEKIADTYKRREEWIGYLAVRTPALQARVIAAGNWEELLKTAEGFQELWEEVERLPISRAEYHLLAPPLFSKYLVHLAASGKRELATEQLRKLELLGHDHLPLFSVATKLMLKLLGVGEGAPWKKVFEASAGEIDPALGFILSMLTGRFHKDKALEECRQLLKMKVDSDAMSSDADVQAVIELLRSCIKKEIQKQHLSLGEMDERTLLEVLAPRFSHARLAFVLLAAVEGRADAVRLHGLLSSAAYKDTMLQPLFRAVYESCSDLNSEGCRMALLKLYSYHL